MPNTKLKVVEGFHVYLGTRDVPSARGVNFHDLVFKNSIDVPNFRAFLQRNRYHDFSMKKDFHFLFSYKGRINCQLLKHRFKVGYTF